MTPLVRFALLALVAAVTLGRLVAQGFGPLAEPSAQSGAAPGPVNIAGAPDRPPGARTVIESNDGASFENATSTADFTGHVVVHDPQFELACDRLHAVLLPDRKGLQQVIATGHVVIVQEKKNDRGETVKSVGKSGKATYDTATGDVALEEWPQIQQGINSQVATQQNTIMILNAKGRSRTIGGSRTVITDQGSEKPVTP